MFLAFLVTQVLATPYSIFTAFLDPYPIGYPNGWLSNTIEISSNHAGQTVTITVYCNLAADLNTGTVVNLKIPGLAAQPSFTLQVPQSSTNDNIFIFRNVTLPSLPGAYGPVSITVYNPSALGADILASAAAYGSIAVLQAKPAPSVLNLAYTTSTIALSSPVSITFSFTLSTILYSNDYLVITIPSPFTGKSAQTDFKKNNSPGNNGNQYFMNTTCVQSASGESNNTVIAYGIIGFDSTRGSATVSGILSGITTPNYSGAIAVWSLEILRFGTRTTRCLYLSSGEIKGANNGAGLVPNNVTVISWTPTNSYLANVYSGLTTYMDLSISIANDIPSGGSITVTFANLAINNCFLSSNNSLISPINLPPQGCKHYFYAQPFNYFNLNASKIAATVVNLPVATKIPAGSNVIIRNLATFSGNAPTVNIVTKDNLYPSPNTINTLSAPYILEIYKSAGHAVISPDPFIQVWNVQTAHTMKDLLAPLTPGLNGVNAFVVSSILQGTTPLLTSTTNMSLSGPFSRFDIPQDTSFALGSPCYLGIPGGYGANSPIIGVTQYSYRPIINKTANSTLSFSIFPVQFQFNSPYPTEANQYINFMLFSGTLNYTRTPAVNYAPNFISSIYTNYEICFEYIVSNSNTYGYCKPLTIFPFGGSTTFGILCTSTGQKGLTAYLEYTPQNIASGGAHFLTLTFTITVSGVPSLDPALSSGLPSGSNFPTSSNDFNATISWNADTSPINSTNINVIYNTSAISSGAPVSIFFPFTALQPNAVYTVTTSFYFTRLFDHAQFLIQQDTLGAVVKSAKGPGSEFNPTPIVPNTPIPSVQPGRTLRQVDITNNFIGTGGVSFIMPAGFTFNSPTLTVSNAKKSAQLFLNSSFSFDQTYGYPSLYYNDTLLSSPPQSIKLNGLIASILSPTASTDNLYIATSASNPFSNAVCADQISVRLTMGAVSLSVTHLVPAAGSTVAQGGIDVLNLTLSCTVTASGAIIGDSSTKITVNIGPQASSGSVYSISGGFSLSGTFSGNSFQTSSITSNILAASASFEISVTIPAPSSITQGFTSISISYLSGTQYIASKISHTLSLSTRPGLTVTSGITSVSAFPNTLGAKQVFFQIVFSPSTAVPAGSTITISGGEGFTSDASAPANTWSSLGFTSSSAASNSLVIVTRVSSTSDTAITIRKDLAYNIPTSSTTGGAWLISVRTPENINIISDLSATTATSLNSITYAGAPSTSLSLFSVAVDTTNAGETAYYTFSFKFSAIFQTSYSIVIDLPFYYDPTFGPVTLVNGSPFNYLSATSTVSSVPICTANHWLVVCSLGVQMLANTQIDLSILGRNPPVTTSTQAFFLYIVDPFSAVVGILQPSSYTSTLKPVPSANVDLQAVVVSNAQSVDSDYTFFFTSTESYSPSGTVSVLFPSQYNFYRDEGTSVENRTCLGTAGSSAIALSCTVNGNNLATFTFSTSESFSGGSLVNLTIKFITNPRASSSFSLQNYVPLNTMLDGSLNAYFEQYSFWTSKFVLYTTTTAPSSSVTWSSKSYSNTNAAFLGLLTGTFLSFNAETAYVIPGTYSTYYNFTTDTGTLTAIQLVLTPSLEFLTIRPASITLYPYAPSGVFQIGAAITTTPVVFYIYWSVAETPLVSGTNLYLPSYKSQAQVYSIGCVTITATNPSVAANSGISLPIFLSTSPYYTYSGLTLTPVSGFDTISFIPQTLEFNSKVNLLKFQVVTAKTPTGAYPIFVNISGVDAAAYSFPQDSILIFVGFPVPAVFLTNMTFAAVTANSFTVTVQTTGSANIYWVVSTTYAYNLNSNYSDLEYVKAHAYPIAENQTAPTQLPLSDQYSLYNASINAIDVKSYIKYIVSLLLIANTHAFFNMDYSQGGSTSYSTTVGGLLANTNYTITIWAENLNGESSDISGNVLTTSDSVTVLTIVFRDNPIGLSENLISALSSVTRQPDYLFVKVENFKRDLGSTGSIAPVALAPSLTNTNPTLGIASSIKPDALVSSLSDLSVKTAGILSIAPSTGTERNFPNPSYSHFSLKIITYRILFLQYTPVVNGEIYYVIEFNPSYDYYITANNVFLGKGRNNVPAYFYGNQSASRGITNYLILNFTNYPFGSYWITAEFCNSIGVCQTNSSLWTYNYDYNNSTVITFSLSKNLIATLYTLVALVF